MHHSYNKLNDQERFQNISEKLFEAAQGELDSIDCDNMIVQLEKILCLVRDDITRKFSNSKNIAKINDIFRSNFATVEDYFKRCLTHTYNAKNNTIEIIRSGLTEFNELFETKRESQPKFKADSHFVFDEEFVSLINSLSGCIKEFVKNSKTYIKKLKKDSEYTEAKIKSCNNLNKSASFKQPSSILEEVESIRQEMSKNIRNIDMNSHQFYEEAKVIFKQLKNLHLDKLKEIEKINTEMSQSRGRRRIDSVSPIPKRNINIHNNSLMDTSASFLNNSRNFSKERTKPFTKLNKSVDLNVRSQTAKKENKVLMEIEILRRRNNEMNNEIEKLNDLYSDALYKIERLKQENEECLQQIANNSEREHSVAVKSENITENNLLSVLIKLSEMVVTFIKQMSELQDAISKKSPMIKEMKKEFEIGKNELMSLAKEIYNRNGDILIEAESHDIVHSQQNHDNSKENIINNNTLIHNDDSCPYLHVINAQQSNFDELQRIIVGLNEEKEAQAEEIKSMNEEIRKLNNKSTIIKRLEDENKGLLGENSNMKQSLEAMRTRGDNTGKDIESLNFELNKQREINSSYEDDLRKNITTVMQLEKKIEKLYAEIKTKEAQLTQCQAAVDSKTKEYSDTVNALNKEIRQQEATINVLDSKIKSKEETIKEFANLNQNFSNLNAKTKEYEDTIIVLNTKLKTTESTNLELTNLNKQSDTTINDLNSKLTSLQNSISILRINNKGYEDTISDLNLKLKSSEDIIKEFSNLNHNYSNLATKIKSHEDTISKLTLENTVYKDHIQDLNDKIESSQENKNAVMKENKDLKKLLEKSQGEMAKEYQLYVEGAEKKLNEEKHKTVEMKKLNTEYQSQINEMQNKLNEYENTLIPNLNLKKDKEMMMLQENLERIMNEEIRQLNENLSNREKELIQMREKYEKLNTLTAKSEETQKDKQQSNNNSKRISDDLELIRKEYLSLSNKLKSMHESLQKNSTTKESSKPKNRHFNVDEAFIYEDDLEIKDEDEEEIDLDSAFTIGNINVRNRENIQAAYNANEISTKKTENDLIIKEISKQISQLLESKSSIKKEFSKKEAFLINENQNLKNNFDECIQTIYEVINSTNPNIIEEMSGVEVESESNKSNEGDFIQKAVEMFKRYLNDINDDNRKIKSELEEMKIYKIKANEYKAALDLAVGRQADVSEKKNLCISPNYVGTNPENSSYTFTKENMNNFTVEDLIETNTIEDKATFLEMIRKEKTEEEEEQSYDRNKHGSTLKGLYEELLMNYKNREIEYLELSEKYELLYNSTKKIDSKYDTAFKSEQERSNEYKIKYDVLIREYENLIRETTKNPGNKSFTNKEDLDEDNILERLNKTSYDQRNNDIRFKHSSPNNHTAGVINPGGIDYISRLNQDDSVLKSQNSMRTDLQEQINKLEENEGLLHEQLQIVKVELKETRQERERYKKMLDDAAKLDSKSEIVVSLKPMIEKLIIEINWNEKIKNIISVVLKILSCTDVEINKIFNAKESKKGFFGGIFGGK